MWGVCVSSLQALPAAAPFLQGLNLRLLSIADQFEPVYREVLFVSPGIFG